MNPEKFYSTKTFHDYPCAHRQHRHHGNCALVHGYSRSFKLTFSASQLNSCGFVVDFGDLKWLRDWLTQKFDHTLLIEREDPYIKQFESLHGAGVCSLVVPPYGVGMEGTAKWIAEYAQSEFDKRSNRGITIVSVEARENEKNSAIYFPPQT